MRDALWTRVEVALDARRSPFDDADLAAELRAEPESESAVQRLLASLEELGRAERLRSRRAPVPWARVAVVLVLLGAGAWLARSAGIRRPREALALGSELTIVVEHTRPAAPRCARVELAPRRVLAWKLEGETP